MDTSLLNSQTVELLSQITGQKLTQKNLTPPVIFLANLVTVLLGVIFVDGTVAESEKQRLLTTLYRFSNPESDVRKLTHLMIKGVKDNQVYKQINNLLALAAPLSESEKLLLIGFGYEMSAADGEIDPHEKKYLEILAKHLGIKPQYLAILEAGFTHQENVEPVDLNEVHFLLSPARFQELDTIFVKAASDMLAALPAKPEHKITKHHSNISYKELAKFQENRKQLETYCGQISQIVKDCNERSFLPYTLIEEIEKVSKKIKLQRFRLAVVGEFSKGKSTLLNALLGEEIQPVREIPCSGAVTVLKHGIQKRIICRYQNGTEEEITFEEYQLKATISENAAIDCLSDELADSQIDEIIFEHPDLELCSSGVEIVDSPGLNEHPDRTKITQKLLKDTDAVIFLTNASCSLTQVERELLQDVKTQLNYGKANEPANNLFVVGNFIDLVRSDKGREQVRQRIERFVKGENPIVAGENRVHLISAQATLEAILQGTENEYLKAFQNFTQSIDKFLTFDSGKLKIKQFITQLNRVVQKSLDGFYQFEDILKGKIKISEVEKQKILENIGEASGRDIKIKNLAEIQQKEVIKQATDSWTKWREELKENITQQSKHWDSLHSPVFSQDKLIKDYINKFTGTMSQEIDIWGNKKLRDVILLKSIEDLDAKIASELNAIQSEFQSIDMHIQTNLSQQLKLSINGINDDFTGFGGIGGGLGIGALAAGLMVFTGLGFIAVIFASVAAAIAGSFGFGMLDFDGLKDKIKGKVIEIGFQKFNESMNKNKLPAKLDEIIGSVFNSRVESASRVIAQAIALYENLLEQQEKAHSETLEQREAEKTWIYQKREELEQVQNGLEVILSKCTII
ncbi:dynamin family protein [Nostoc sp. 'Peltigera membranacea cyanobiont' 210A]|uniref:dynamin family protein n=1 Tax=Nostoc sp. 'Peltigera membranacea cyanobiont' 210A TaxID=2014529 RepID=UPI000B951DB9|nr:dynamin family protein [Nostoc sp. 'Peltigera membranacea cyanobiont' 210A]OYD96504.1 dynamin family protein [Nostoc sp. 'Peltigera membranacea cyanobiont' 210A]